MRKQKIKLWNGGQLVFIPGQIMKRSYIWIGDKDDNCVSHFDDLPTLRKLRGWCDKIIRAKSK